MRWQPFKEPLCSALLRRRLRWRLHQPRPRRSLIVSCGSGIASSSRDLSRHNSSRLLLHMPFCRHVYRPSSAPRTCDPSHAVLQDTKTPRHSDACTCYSTYTSMSVNVSERQREKEMLPLPFAQAEHACPCRCANLGPRLPVRPWPLRQPAS